MIQERVSCSWSEFYLLTLHRSAALVSRTRRRTRKTTTHSPCSLRVQLCQYSTEGRQRGGRTQQRGEAAHSREGRPHTAQRGGLTQQRGEASHSREGRPHTAELCHRFTQPAEIHSVQCIMGHDHLKRYCGSATAAHGKLFWFVFFPPHLKNQHPQNV